MTSSSLVMVRWAALEAWPKGAWPTCAVKMDADKANSPFAGNEEIDDNNLSRIAETVNKTEWVPLIAEAEAELEFPLPIASSWDSL